MTDQPTHDGAADAAPIPQGVPPDDDRLSDAMTRLARIIAKLRSPEGCPWDRIQTMKTIKPYTLEETHELLAAIDSDDNDAICEELGDLLLQVVLDSQIAADEGRFTLIDVIEGIAAKMVHRHPHVFADARAEKPEDVSQHWEQAKQTEKKRDSIFSGLPLTLPALVRAVRVTHKAAKVGYDFPQREMLFDKLREEMQELANELFDGGEIPNVRATVDDEIVADAPIADPIRRHRVEEEFGDVLFVLANVARRWGINPEDALKRSTDKFEKRVRYIESELSRQGRNIQEVTLAEMEKLYQAGKAAEKRELPRTDS